MPRFATAVVLVVCAASTSYAHDSASRFTIARPFLRKARVAVSPGAGLTARAASSLSGKSTEWKDDTQRVVLDSDTLGGPAAVTTTRTIASQTFDRSARIHRAEITSPTGRRVTVVQRKRGVSIFLSPSAAHEPAHVDFEELGPAVAAANRWLDTPIAADTRP